MSANTGAAATFSASPPRRAGIFWYASYRSELGPVWIDVGSALEQARKRYAGHAAAIRQVLAPPLPEPSLRRDLDYSAA